MVEYVKLEVSLPKESHEVAREVVGLVNDVRAALADGYQPSDLAVIVASAVSRLGVAVQGWEKLGPESKGDPAGVVKALALNLSDLFVKNQDEKA